MKFEVIGPDGKCKMSTLYASCVPDKDTLKHMVGAGYSFRVNGKKIKLNDIDTAIKGCNIKYKIRCEDTGEVFDKQSEAAKHYNIDPAAVSDSLKTGKRRSGYIFTKIEVAE